MAIEFPCARCGQLVRTPDSAAGKKGKCPNCGQVQRIPSSETPPPPKPPAQPAAPSASPSSAPAQTPRQKERPKPATSKLIIPDPPSLTPPPQPTAPTPKLPEPKLNPPASVPGKAASQWTSYVKRGAESIRPTPMPPADPRIAPRGPAEKQVLPPLAPATKTPRETPPAANLTPNTTEDRPSDEAEQPGQPLSKRSPASATSSESTHAASSATKQVAPSPPVVNDKFEFPCPSCGKENRASRVTASKKGRCPHCHAIMQIPALPTVPEPPSTPMAAAAAPRTPAIPTMPVVAAGKNTTEESNLPAEQQSSSKTNSIGPGRKWDTKPAREAPAEIPSLTPIPAGEEELPELTPLTPEQIARLIALETAETAPALTPLGPISAADSGTSTAYASAPYATVGWGPPPSHPRRGLPWERESSIGALLQTAWTVVFSPTHAFREMRQTGGLGEAIGFAAMIGFGVAVVTAVFTVLFMSAVGGLAANLSPPNRPLANPALRNSLAPGILHLLGRQAGTNLGIATFQFTVSALITSGLTHGLMVLFGGARGGFGTTFRVFLYCMASTAFFQFIPCCGVWIGLLWTVPILMVGMSYAHDASGLSAAGAVFLGVGVYYAALLCILSIFFLGIIYAAAGPGLSG